MLRLIREEMIGKDREIFDLLKLIVSRFQSFYTMPELYDIVYFMLGWGHDIGGSEL